MKNKYTTPCLITFLIIVTGFDKGNVTDTLILSSSTCLAVY